MDEGAWIAIIGSIIIGLVVRLSNMLVAWLARLMGVEPPEPIPTAAEITDHKAE